MFQFTVVTRAVVIVVCKSDFHAIHFNFDFFPSGFYPVFLFYILFFKCQLFRKFQILQIMHKSRASAY